MELTYLLLKDLKNWNFQLIEDYVYNVKDYIIKVPRGFITNFASIPKVFRIILLPYGKYSSASVVHDWLYSKKCYMQISRKEADNIFLEIMEECEVNFVIRYSMYILVRMFGEEYYRR